jgi:hypothetical protein
MEQNVSTAVQLGTSQANCRRPPKRTVNCKICGKLGHYKYDCHQFNQNKKQKSYHISDQNKMMVLFQKSTEFIFDSGATCSCCCEMV